MISVVICSVNRDLAVQVSRNIGETIGVDWEMILIDNSVDKKGITEVYNLGASRAKFDIITFVHEDVLFNTQNWGALIIRYFREDKDLSVVGVAGSKYKSRTLSGWATGIRSLDCCNILHLDTYGVQQKIYSNPLSKNIDYTVTVDGVFISTRKTSWIENKFSNTIKGFHLYDIDYSFRQSLNSKVAVTFEIDMVHITKGGNFGNEWLMNTIMWHEAWRSRLPVSTINVPTPRVELVIAKKWLHRLRNENISFANRIKWLRDTEAYKHPILWPHIAVFLTWNILQR